MHVRTKLVIFPELSRQQYLFTALHQLRETGLDGWIWMDGWMNEYLCIVYGCGGAIRIVQCEYQMITVLYMLILHIPG
jgi:hypothetical protein